MSSWLLTDVDIVAMNGPAAQPLGEIRRGALRIRGDTIAAVGALVPEAGERVVDGAGAVVTPGFVQGHVHATQTLFRGLADDLALLPWLQQRIWPLEHAHDEASTRASAELTFAELIRGGTTTVQTMESVRHAEITAAVASASGLTVITGNCLMDVIGDGVPKGMATTPAEALRRTDELRRAFDGHGRLHIAVSPRFVLSCSDGLMRDAALYAELHGLRLHTHAAEHPDEIAAVRTAFGRDTIEVLDAQGVLGPRTALAHCVHTSIADRERLAATATAVLHCPSTNLKLGSGIAPIADYDRRGLRLALGADGAPCNNRLSMLTELRQAALLSCFAAGPGAFAAERALWTATRGGALALGLDDVGHLVAGARADLLLWQLDDALGSGPVAGRLVYAATEAQLRDVVLGGEFVVRGGTPCDRDFAAAARRAAAALPDVLRRAGLAS